MCAIFETVGHLNAKHKLFSFLKKENRSRNTKKDLYQIAVRHEGRLQSRGVKSACVLNNVDGVHIMSNFALDPMPVPLEGIVPPEIG